MNHFWKAARGVVLTLLIAAAPGALFADADLQITTTSESINVTGATRGADVVIFGVAREGLVMKTRVHRVREVVTDTDRDGSVNLVVDAARVPAAVWIAVDLVNGHAGVSSGTANSIREMRSKRGTFRRGAAGKSDQFALPRIFLDLLYVHAGGAWTWSIIDGAADDYDGPNGLIVADLQRAKALRPGHGRPDEFLPGGTLFMIDSDTLEISTMRLDAALLGGQQ